MKKVTIVGRGTVGAMAVAHFRKNTDWAIDWVYDTNMSPTSVGEGSNLIFPRVLHQSMFMDSEDMDNIMATAKLGIWKRGWGSGTDFKHTFPIGAHGIHFSAVEFQQYMFNKLSQDKRITIIERNVDNYEDIDSDFVMVCSGTPKNFTTDYILRDKIPVNTATVFQCPWNMSLFNYSITFAKKFGWVFGIPLTSRCSIGYVYNGNLNTEQEITEDVQELLSEFNLVPSAIRTLKFSNYSKKNNYTKKVVYNGNASFFLEPLEATSIGFAAMIVENAHTMWLGYQTPQELQRKYDSGLNEIESMICLHYFAGSVYNTPFWSHAQQLANSKISEDIRNKTSFANILREALKYEITDLNIPFMPDVASWSLRSYVQNIRGLDIANKLQKIIL